MRKLLFFIAFILLIVQFNTARAQFEYFGGGISLATGGEYKYQDLPYYNNSFGIDLRMVYDYSKKLQIVPDLKFYIPNKEKFTTGESKTTVVALNVNAHYILNWRSRNNYRVYLLGGAHVGFWNIKDDHTSTLLNRTYDYSEYMFVPGANAGAGMQFPLGASAIFFAEIKYTVSKSSQMVFTPGLLFLL